MSDEYPKYFYKYRSIDENKEPSENCSIRALLENKAIFSCRKEFNDLFDSKISLIKPQPRQLKELMRTLGKHQRRDAREYLSNGQFTPKGYDLISSLEREFNNPDLALVSCSS